MYSSIMLVQMYYFNDFTSKNMISDEGINHLAKAQGIRAASTTSVNALNPLFSIEPLKTSLHPKYKLWTEMDTQQQNEAIHSVGEYMKKYGQIIAPKGTPLRKLSSVTHGKCTFAEEFEKDGHKICTTGQDATDPIHPPCILLVLASMMIPHLISF